MLVFAHLNCSWSRCVGLLPLRTGAFTLSFWMIFFSWERSHGFSTKFTWKKKQNNNVINMNLFFFFSVHTIRYFVFVFCFTVFWMFVWILNRLSYRLKMSRWGRSFWAKQKSSMTIPIWKESEGITF